MPTEIACFFSHYTLWHRIANGSRPSLILEDDVILSHHLPDFLKQIQHLDGIDHLTLETRLRKKLLGPIHSLNNNLGVARLYQDRTGAAAYILWPEGARLLLKRAKEKGAALADAFISCEYKLCSWQATPALAIQSDVACNYGLQPDLKTHSYIQSDSKKNSHSTHRSAIYRYKIKRILGQLRLAIRFISYINKSHRTHVMIAKS